MNNTLSIPLQSKLVEMLKIFGDPESVAVAALRHYALDRCLQRIEQAEQRIAHYQTQYGASYEVFNQRVCTDQTFLDKVNRIYPTWEADAIEWVERIEEAKRWRQRLEAILQESWLSPVSS